ncbi:hypothetical protein EPN83_00450 [Patescibacteria group bacterium]|nr:MAG: hypothetical protein EPN83_00450 [Patescibacteria group bacterium]
MKNGVKLEVSVGTSDVVHVTIGGNLEARHLPKFAEWAQKVKETIKSLFDKKGERVLCLIDISELHQYDAEVVTQLVALMKENEPYVLRTATFGGTQYMIMAEDVVVALSGRKNLKGFRNKEEAIEWLLHGEAE